MKLGCACRQFSRIALFRSTPATGHFTQQKPGLHGYRALSHVTLVVDQAAMDSRTERVSYLGQETAKKIDEELMGPLGFSVDQLMELAGLSVATSIADAYPLPSFGRVLVLAGPGNNGGDGLVAARHLHHFGYRITVCYPKRTERQLYYGLVTQCQSLGINFIESDQVLNSSLSSQADIILDALFGFSFKGKPRPPFDALIQAMSPPENPPPVVSVDVPSGWDVEDGDVAGNGLRPDMLISLTAPKEAARKFTGNFHYLGGRFVPPEILAKYELKLPSYPGTAQCVRLSTESRSPSDVAAMRMHYGAAGKDLDESSAALDPLNQFSAWFEDAKASGAREPNAMALATVGPDNAPSLRMVLLKGISSSGLTFYTNYGSRKGKELESNPSVAVTFFWEALERQVRFEGCVEPLPDHESDAYWNSRPWAHQIGALASRQSEVVIEGRRELEDREEAMAKAYPEGGPTPPRPSGWGGFLVRPHVIEFWQGRPSRLHDRLRYSTQEGGEWKIERLSP